MRSHTSITVTHLPTELLSQILKNVNAAYLHTASLTCRLFHDIAKPLIFRKFVLKYDADEDERGANHGARLEFYSSDAVAPFVREFRYGMFSSLSSDNDETEPVDMFAKVFDALPRFINIRSLSFFGIIFTEFALHQVSKLSSLEHVDVMDCSAPPKTDSLPVLRLRSFAVDSDPDEVYGHEAHRWLVLLDTDYLRDLRVPLTEGLCSFIANANPFPSLHSVDFDADEEMLPMLLMILSKTPALRNLQLFPSCPGTPQQIHIMEGLVASTTCLVPYLETYRGPHMLLPIILGHTMGAQSVHPRRVFLRGIDELGDPLDSFMTSLKSCRPPLLRALTHVHISVLESMDLKSLATLQDMFPVLQEFKLHALEHYNDIIVQNVDLTDLYTIALPSTLVSLSIQWTSDPNAGVVSDLVAAKDNLIQRLPDLCHLWLCDFSKRAISWSRTAPRAEERLTLHEADELEDLVFPF